MAEDVWPERFTTLSGFAQRRCPGVIPANFLGSADPRRAGGDQATAAEGQSTPSAGRHKGRHMFAAARDSSLLDQNLMRHLLHGRTCHQRVLRLVAPLPTQIGSQQVVQPGNVVPEKSA